MPLPQQVINQLSQDPVETPSWFGGALLFSGMLLVLAVGFYLGLLLVYQPYLNNNLAAVQTKIATVDQSVASGDQAQLVAFYSQVVNLKSLLGNHVISSQLLNWLGQNTEANVYYSQFSFSSNDLTLSGHAASEADISQQVAIFEASPDVQSVVVSGIGGLDTANTLTFSVALTLSPSLFTATTTNPAPPTTP